MEAIAAQGEPVHGARLQVDQAHRGEHGGHGGQLVQLIDRETNTRPTSAPAVVAAAARKSDQPATAEAATSGSLPWAHGVTSCSRPPPARGASPAKRRWASVRCWMSTWEVTLMPMPASSAGSTYSPTVTSESNSASSASEGVLRAAVGERLQQVEVEAGDARPAAGR